MVGVCWRAPKATEESRSLATTVTLTIADADAARCVNAATNPGQIQAGPIPPQFPPTGATNAAVLKAWLIALVQEATVLHEAKRGLVGANTPPAIT